MMEEIVIDKEKQNQPSQYITCISEEHPYYSILGQKMKVLPGIFDIDAKPQPKIPETPYGLKIFNKQGQNQKINIFVYTFTFPVSYSFYEQMQNDIQLQKSFDINIDTYQHRQIVDESTKIIYLAYKKIFIVAPRDFVYVRYSFQKGDQNWSVATSLTDEEPVMGKTRGTIIMTATRVIQKDGQVFVSIYSQIDMKMGVKAAGTKQKGIIEIKKYLDRCYSYIQEQKSKAI